MKRILAITLTLVMVLAALTGCNASKKPSGKEGEQPKQAQCLNEENGVYKLTLPKSKEVIELYEEQVRFVPYITDALVEVAENKITEDVSQHSNHSNFFLQITNDYLCLVVEVIKSIDPPVSAEEGEIADGGCGIDHEHLFFSERISSKAVADNKELHFGTSDEDYGKIQFFPQPTLEFTEEDTYDTTVLEWTRLTDGDVDLLRQVYNDGKGWIDDSVVDRVPFYFDGRIRFATMDSCGWMYFGIDQNVLYYNGMFTQINSKVLYIIEKAQNTISGSDNSSQENDYLVNHIQISSGVKTIYPFGCMTWSKIDNDDGTFSESFVDKYDVIDLVSGKTPFAITDIPKLVLNDKVSYFVQVNGRVEKVYLLTPNDDTYTKSETTFDALSNLADGTYYVVLEVLLSGNCDPDAPQNSYRYEDVFCLVVGDDDNSHDDGIPPYDAMLNLEVWNGKFEFQRIATTPCIVYSNTPINDMSKGTVFEDRHDILTTIFQAMHGKDAIMDTPECEFSRYIYMFDNERENIPWHYRFAICNCGAVMITNNDELICTIKLNEEELRSIIPADLLVDLEPSDTNNATEFSYADELAMFPEGTPGVKKTGFRNTTELPVHNDVEAIGRAKNECTIEWSATEVYYDATKEIWKVTFYTKGVPGGDQSVYLGANGITLMIVYGE